MRKRYIIMKILICIIALLGYLQYGREEQAVNTMVSTSDTFYKQEFDVIANKLFNLDKEKYAEELIAKAVENKYRNVRFSYDITGYSNEWSYEHNQRMYQIIYSSDNDSNNVKNNADKFKIQIYEK